MKAKLLTIGCLLFTVCGTAFLSSKEEFVIPANFPQPVYDFKGNKVTKQGFELGRHLFYDPLLSKDKTISCENCHQAFAAFSNFDHPVSHGVDDCEGTRNAPPLFNLAWQKEFMWDGGVNHIELSPLNAIVNPCELANDLDSVVSRLQNSPVYRKMFKAAFGSQRITSQLTLRALAQFTSMLISAGSKYDKVMRHEGNTSFTPIEKKGYVLFRLNCAKCHKEPLFTDLSYRSNGLDIDPADIGRDSITQNQADLGKFRVPSLRNIELTAPYMHDGRFSDLNEVLSHYTNGVKDFKNLDPELRKNGHLGIRLRSDEQTQLIAFLKTLTDRDFIRDPRFQSPGNGR